MPQTPLTESLGEGFPCSLCNEHFTLTYSSWAYCVHKSFWLEWKFSFLLLMDFTHHISPGFSIPSSGEPFGTQAKVSWYLVYVSIKSSVAQAMWLHGLWVFMFSASTPRNYSSHENLSWEFIQCLTLKWWSLIAFRCELSNVFFLK